MSYQSSCLHLAHIVNVHARVLDRTQSIDHLGYDKRTFATSKLLSPPRDFWNYFG